MEKVIISEPIINEPPSVEKCELLRFIKDSFGNDGFNKIATKNGKEKKRIFVK